MKPNIAVPLGNSPLMRIILLMLLLLAFKEIYAQRNTKIDSLENERFKNQKKIEELTQTISSTGKTKEVTLSEYQARKALLERYVKDIKIIQQQQAWLKEQIQDTKDLIEALERDEQEARIAHDKAMYELSKLENQIKSSAIGILSVDSWNELNQNKSKLIQLQRELSLRAAAINAITKKSVARRKELDNLENRLNAIEQSLKSNIAFEEQRRKDLEQRFKELQKREKDFQAQKAILEKFNKAITQEIDNFLTLRNTNWNNSKTNNVSPALQPDINNSSDKKNKIVGKTIEPLAKNIGTAKPTPAGNIRNKVFAENKSLLPWPVERFSLIAMPFGIYTHPSMPNIEIENLGIDIMTMRNEYVRSVFDGTVINVNYEKDMGWVVIVQHDDYMCVYARLQNVLVKNGSRVKARAILGTVGLNQDGYPVLQFQIWKNKQNLNPEDWLAKNTDN